MLQTKHIYRELDTMPKLRIKIAFKCDRKYIAKVNVSNLAHPSQHIDIEISCGSRDHHIVPDTINITFNLDTESTDKAPSIVNNIAL